MRELTARHLASYDHTWKYLPQTLVEIPLTALATEAPAGTVLVPREESFLFEVSGVEIKGDDEHGVDAQYPWEEHPQRSHSQILAVGPFYLDKFPVTAANYSVYLEATGYEPAEAYNWLKNWDGPRRNRGPACDLPQHRRGARLLRLEGRAPATLLGVAVRSLGHRRVPLSLGR
jgi:formylglycine-generating enzyme required for sulfatase activity